MDSPSIRLLLVVTVSLPLPHLVSPLLYDPVHQFQDLEKWLLEGCRATPWFKTRRWRKEPRGWRGSSLNSGGRLTRVLTGGEEVYCVEVSRREWRKWFDVKLPGGHWYYFGSDMIIFQTDDQPGFCCSPSWCVARANWSSTWPGSSSTQPSPLPCPPSDWHWDWVLDLSGWPCWRCPPLTRTYWSPLIRQYCDINLLVQ